MDSPTLITVAAFLLIILIVGCWLMMGTGPRLRRALRQAEELLKANSWPQAMEVVQPWLNANLPEHQQQAVTQLYGKCHLASAEQSLASKKYEAALQTFQQAAPYLALDENALRRRVQSSMLQEARALFASLPTQIVADQPEVNALHELLTRVLMIRDDCGEVYFWQALIQIKLHEVEKAGPLLERAHELSNQQFLDPLFYRGALYFGEGKPSEALKTLSEANRIDARCPLITWLMGRAMVAAEGDSGMSIRILQKALSTQGLGLWKDRPQRIWVEAFPEGRSYVRQLAEKHRYVCPIFGAELSFFVRLGQLALAQAHFRQGHYQESANLYTELMRDAAPSFPLLRGLGMSLAKQNRYDEAFKHLRAALEMQPNDAQLTGHLAVCGACGTIKNAEDKPKNIAWSLRQFTRFDILHDQEWANLQLKVHQEAHAANYTVPCADQIRLCDALTSVHAVTAEAAVAYDHLARSCPDQTQSAHAWHYCQAAKEHGVQGQADLQLFELAFRNRETIERFFEQQQWDVKEVEYLYLKRFSANQSGHFPPVLGESYATVGAERLLSRSKELEQANDMEQAREAVEVLLALSPKSIEAHDRLACLYFRQGDKEKALELLTALQQLAPQDPLPFVRRAVIEHQQQHWDNCRVQLQRAMELTQNSQRASIAFLAAKLALTQSPEEAEGFLQDCLQHQADHVDALCTLAAVRALRSDIEGLKLLVPQMGREEINDSKYQYFSSLCYLVSGDYGRAGEWAQRASKDRSLTIECQYLQASAYLQLNETEKAIPLLTEVAKSNSPSANHARAILGKTHHLQGMFLESVKWWTGVDKEKRAEWNVDVPLRYTVFLTALSAMEKGRYEQAAERFKEAGQLGLRERSLGELIRLAYFKGGQQLYYQE